ncbi:MAG: hypothetical protein AAB590_01500 [Patescibacteria group bacterium]
MSAYLDKTFFRFLFAFLGIILGSFLLMYAIEEKEKNNTLPAQASLEALTN